MLYIIIEEHSGILVSIYRCLTNAHYSISSNSLGKRAGDGKPYVKLSIEQGELPLPSSLEGEILNINGCSDILYDEPTHADFSSKDKRTTSAGTDGLKKEIKIISKEIVNDFDNIENIVHSFTQKHQGENNANDVYLLGYSVGAMIYEVEYSLGKPLKLELALKRMLADAIQSFGTVSCNQHIISIEHNIFCNTATSKGYCDFTKGFMSGFLHFSPTTKNVRVENITCRCQGRSACVFEFH